MGVPCFGIILWTWRLSCWAGVFRHPRSSPFGVFTRDKWLLIGRRLLSQGETPIINVGCSSFLQAVWHVLISLSLTHVLPSTPPIIISSGNSYPDLAPLGVKRSFTWLAHHRGLPHSILLSSGFLPASPLDPMTPWPRWSWLTAAKAISVILNWWCHSWRQALLVCDPKIFSFSLNGILVLNGSVTYHHKHHTDTLLVSRGSQDLVQTKQMLVEACWTGLWESNCSL